MNEQLWNLTITVISGVVVYVICQWYTEFVLRPIHEYKQLKAKVAKLLVLHAQYYSNPWIYDSDGDCTAWKTASAEMRELAADVAAFTEIKPSQWLVVCAIPSKKRLLEAQRYLIGLSNSFFTYPSGEERCIDRVCDYPDIIRKNMGITYTRKKVKR